MIRAIIFDCFGVIRVDTTQLAYEALGGDFAADHEFVTALMYRSNTGQIKGAGPYLAEKLGVSKAVWKQKVKELSGIDQKVLDYAMELKKTFKTGLLSNMRKGGLDIWFEPGFLDPYFDVMVCSGDIGYAKPEPEAYEIVADKLGMRLDECVFIDDRQDYVDGARAVGMKGVLFFSSTQLRDDLSVILK